MISRKLFALCASLVALQLPLTLSVSYPQQALAIPKQDAIAKLKYITVHVIVNPEDEFVYSQQGEYSIVSVFLSKEAAQKQLELFQKSDPLFNGSLKRYTLDSLFPIMELAQSQSSADSTKILFPIVNLDQNSDKAREILRESGLSDDQIDKNLRVPIFYTEPMVNMTMSNIGNRQFFFVDYPPLESALRQMPLGSPKPKLKVLNLDQVLDVIIKEDQDIFAIYPNLQFLSESSN